MTDALDTLARRLRTARLDDARVPLPPTPPTLHEARDVQRRIDALEGSEVIGFKLGATLAPTLAAFALARPFFGTLHARNHHPDGATVRLPRAYPASVETEIVVTLAHDLALAPDPAGPEAQDPARVRRVAEAVGSVSAGFELVGTRFAMPMAGNGTALVADAAANVATVSGSGGGHALDVAAMPGQAVTLEIDGERRASGHGRDSLGGHPFAMVAWLLGRRAFAERGLKAGEVVYCGTCTGAIPVVPGQRLAADFGALGSVSAYLE